MYYFNRSSGNISNLRNWQAQKKVIYIESFARVDGSSMTGKLMKAVADLYIVQWRELLDAVPNAVYGGGIF